MKKFLSLLAVVVIAVVLAGCTKKKVHIGIVLPTKEEPRWVQDEQRFKDALKDTEYTVEILFSNGSTATEKENVEALITKGIDVLIICAHDGTAAASAIELAKEEGITVIAYDRLITNTDAVDYYITFDSVAVGKAQGKFLVESAGDDLVAGAGLPLFLYSGGSFDNNAFLFFEGALSELRPHIANGAFEVQNYSGTTDLTKPLTTDKDRTKLAEVMGKIDTEWDFATAKGLAESNITNYLAGDGSADDTVFILAPNDGTARNIADAFIDEDFTYFITGQDAEVPSIQYIIDGKQSMTVFKDVRELVKGAINMAVKVLEGETPATDATYNNGKINVKSKQVEIIVVKKDNVKAKLIDTNYYKQTDFTWPN